MRIFISEYLCSGAWPDAELDASLACEGRAMLLALLVDAAQVPGWTVCTTWDQRLGAFPLRAVEARTVRTPQEEARAFAELAASADGVYVIAPELDDQLTARCRSVLECGGRVLNSSLPVLQWCSDKLSTYERLESAGVPTIPTRRLTTDDRDIDARPVVVKPRFGAGSHETRLVRDAATLCDITRHADQAPAVRQMIVQPFVAGRALSVALIVRGGDKPIEVWPVAEQRLTSDGRFQYCGGRIPAHDIPTRQIRELAARAASALPGLRGYAGLDIIVPDDAPDQPLVVEVNPRLTTSYLGYRALATRNLAPHVMLADQVVERADWRQAAVTFDAAGRIISG